MYWRNFEGIIVKKILNDNIDKSFINKKYLVVKLLKQLFIKRNEVSDKDIENVYSKDVEINIKKKRKLHKYMESMKNKRKRITKMMKKRIMEIVVNYIADKE